jgi:RND family efflux transporter MFP subunit
MDRDVLRQLRTLFDAGTVGDLTDGQLLERFATGRGEAAERAFAALVERHGPMVLRVCRGVLADPDDALDAFQATFLVLVRKARALWVQDSLGPWLHQVAYRTACCARSAAERRRRHERRAAEMAAARPERQENGFGPEFEQAVHAEIARLPESFRVPIVLCDLEGCSHEQAARHLGWPIGTVKSRLSRGRERLRARLLRRGLAPDAGLLAAALRPDGPAALLPPALVDSTTIAAVQFAAVRTIVRGSAASLLAQGVLTSMSMTRWFKVASVLLTLGATVSGARLLAQRGEPGPGPAAEPTAKAVQVDGMPVSEVKPGKLRVSVIERGNLESASNKDVYSHVEGQTTIIMILPEGMKVKKGDIVCELDSASLKDRLVNQEISVKAAEAAYQRAKVAREIAEIAVAEYEQGIYKQQHEAALGEIKLAEAKRKRAESQLERTRLARQRVVDALAPKGAARTPADVVTELNLDDRLAKAQLTLQGETFAFERAQTKFDVLERYTRDKTIKGLRVEVEQKRSEELAKQAAVELERSKEEKLRRQIAYCRIVAPDDGIVVYANDPYRFPGQNRYQIEEGATVRERQKIFSIPDLSRLQVNVKVHESMVDRVSNGLPVKVMVDAFPEEVLTGVVTEVAPLPDAANFFNADVKVYTTRVRLDRTLPGLRPGMTASSEILIKELDDVISVPVRAILTFDGKAHVAVKKPGGGFEWREVTLGIANDEVVEVKEGLRSGEAVALTPIDLMSEYEKRQKKLGEPTRPAAAKADGGDALKVPAVPGATGKGKGAAKGKGVALPPSLRAKLQAIPKEDRTKFITGTPEERGEILKKAGFTAEEIEQLNRLRPAAPAAKVPSGP